jgi:hypothetical protein
MSTSAAAGIVDIQCVLGINNRYYVKELSIIDADLDCCASQHYIMKSPSEYQNARSRSVNNWLFRNYHQLSLECGDVEYSELDQIFDSLTYSCIYVKGEQKQKIIQNYLPNVEIVDLQQLGCPRLSQICANISQKPSSLPSPVACCLYHKNLNYTKCTYYRIFMLKKWFLNNS